MGQKKERKTKTSRQKKIIKGKLGMKEWKITGRYFKVWIDNSGNIQNTLRINYNGEYLDVRPDLTGLTYYQLPIGDSKKKRVVDSIVLNGITIKPTRIYGIVPDEYVSYFETVSKFLDTEKPFKGLTIRATELVDINTVGDDVLAVLRPPSANILQVIPQVGSGIQALDIVYNFGNSEIKHPDIIHADSSHNNSICFTIYEMKNEAYEIKESKHDPTSTWPGSSDPDELLERYKSTKGWSFDGKGMVSRLKKI